VEAKAKAMIEALGPLRPAIPGLGIGRRSDPAFGVAARTVAAPRAKAEARRPVHLAVIVGLSAGAYAASLAGVTALQAATDRTVSDGYAPTSEAADLLRTNHDQLETRLAAAAAAYDKAAAVYGGLSGNLKAYETQLQALAKQVASVKGNATWVPPAAGGLPSVGRAAAPAAKPASHATTCASGKTCP
jgi:hypothetical protein